MNKKIIKFINIYSNTPRDLENMIDKIKIIGDKITPYIENNTEENLQKIINIIEKDLVFIDKHHEAFHKELYQTSVPLINLTVNFCFLFNDKDIFANTRFDYRLWEVYE